MSRDWSKVKEICDRATPGPWEAVGCNGELTGVNGPSGFDHEVGVIEGQLEVYGINDADFIATSRTSLPDAIAEIEQLRTENKVMKTILAFSDQVAEIERLRHEKDIWEQLANNLADLALALIASDIIKAEEAKSRLREICAKLKGGEPNA